MATNLNDTVISSSKVTLTWTASPGATKYKVRLSKDGGTTWGDSVEVTSPTRTYQTLLASTTYKWQVNAACDGAYRGYVNGTDFMTLPPARYGTLEEDEVTYSVFPNPSATGFQIDIADKSGSIDVLDAQGAIIHSSSITEKLTIGETWSPGMYIVHLRVEGKLHTYKLIKL